MKLGWNILYWFTNRQTYWLFKMTTEWMHSYHFDKMLLQWITVIVKPGLHLNANRIQTWHAKTKWLFNVDVLPRRGEQHSAVRRTFGKQPNTIYRLSVLQRLCRVCLLPQRMPNSVQMCHMFCLASTCVVNVRFQMQTQF